MATRIEAGSGENREHGPKLRGWVIAALGVVAVAAVTAGVLRWQDSDEAAAPAPVAETAASGGGVGADVTPPKTVAPEQPVVYIVATQEAADRQSRALAEADQIRNAMGLPPLEYSVFVAATPELAHGFIRATEDANMIRAGEGLAIYQVVDLRR